MALSQSAVSELLEAFRTTDGLDLVKESVRLVLQELIEAEASEHFGAARYERTQDRTTERNGARAQGDHHPGRGRRACGSPRHARGPRSSRAFWCRGGGSTTPCTR